MYISTKCTLYFLYPVRYGWASLPYFKLFIHQQTVIRGALYLTSAAQWYRCIGERNSADSLYAPRFFLCP